MALDKDDPLLKILTDNNKLKIFLIFWIILMIIVISSFVFSLGPLNSMGFYLDSNIPNGYELEEIKIVTYNGDSAQDKSIIKIREVDYDKIFDFLYSLDTGAFKAVEGEINHTIVLSYAGSYDYQVVIISFYNNFKYISISSGQSRIELYKLENPEVAKQFFNEFVRK